MESPITKTAERRMIRRPAIAFRRILIKTHRKGWVRICWTAPKTVFFKVTTW
jgi:hypothetical protein